MKVICYIIKALSLLAGLAVYANMLPAKWAMIAALAFAGASTLKDWLIHLGDILDDGQENQSFKP